MQCCRLAGAAAGLRGASAPLLFRSLHVTGVQKDRQRQPTGRAGTPSPWNRTPFFHERGPGAGVDLSLQDRLARLDTDNKGERVDIGFRPVRAVGSGRSQIAEWRRRVRSDAALERAAREGKLEVDLAVVRQQWQQSGAVFTDIAAAAELYGVYEDMYGHAQFSPCVLLDLQYKQEKYAVPVHRGNVIKPREAANAPAVQWESSAEARWCLVMTSLDSHLQEEGAEYLHWMVANIQGSDLQTGQTLCNYLQPFPAFGTGYQRFVFVLYRQEGELDWTGQGVKEEGEVDLAARTFRTVDWYRHHQDSLTPAGLAFFQSDYDTSMRDFFHHTLNMKEPRFEYEFPEWFIAPWYQPQPTNIRAGFDEFLDRHRDPKDLEREVLELKLKTTHPYEGDTESYLRYPGVHEEELLETFPAPIGHKKFNHQQSYKIAQWRRNAIQKQRLRQRHFRSVGHRSLRRDPSLLSL